MFFAHFFNFELLPKFWILNFWIVYSPICNWFLKSLHLLMLLTLDLSYLLHRLSQYFHALSVLVGCVHNYRRCTFGTRFSLFNTIFSKAFLIQNRCQYSPIFSFLHISHFNHSSMWNKYIAPICGHYLNII